MKMKKNDWILIFIILCVASACLFLYAKWGMKTTGRVVVKVDGEVFGTYSLSKDVDVPIGDTNRLEIKDRKVRMIEANCPDQICVHHKPISKNKETIVCLPNKVIISIASDEKAKLDTVAE